LTIALPGQHHAAAAVARSRPNRRRGPDMPDWLTETLDALPPRMATLYFSLFFVAVAWAGIIFLRPFFRLWLRRQPGLNEIVSYVSASFSLFYGLLLGLLSVAAFNTLQEIENAVSREAGAINTIYRSASPEPTRSEVQYLLRDYTLYVIHKMSSTRTGRRTARG
jgi:hypothetical protein